MNCIVNVLIFLSVTVQGQDTAFLIGTVGQSIIMSCGTEVDIEAASEKHWCRLTDETVCQPDMILSPEKEIEGDFKILDSHSSFSLQKNQLTHNDTGFYRLTLALGNETKVCVVELQVKDNPNFLEIVPVHIKSNPHKPFEIMCRYSQNLQRFPKYWLCDQTQCPRSVRGRDDRFQSALILTLDHVACSKIKSFHCVVTMPGKSIRSDVYQKPRYTNPIREEHLYFTRYRKVEVNAYSSLHLFCSKPDPYYRYDRYDSYDRNRRPTWDFHNNYFSWWCRVEGAYCVEAKENVRQTLWSVILEICVTPNDNGAKYRCKSDNPKEVELVVTAPPPTPPPPPPRPPEKNTPLLIPPRPNNKVELSVGIAVIITIAILLMGLFYIIYFTRCNSQRLRERSRALFTRKTPLSAVDVHADMYANSLANYYSNNQQGQSSDGQQEGNDKGDASSSDEEFEEWPARPQTSISIKQEESDYVRVQTRGSAQKKTNTKRAATKQGSAKSGSGGSQDKEEEDEDEVTYTHVVIKPKQTLE